MAKSEEPHINQLTYEELHRLTDRNLKFIEKLSDREKKELWDNNLRKSLEGDLKEIESRLNILSKFLNFSEKSSRYH